MSKNKTDRSVRKIGISFSVVMLVFYLLIIGEIFFDLPSIITTIAFLVYTILNIAYCFFSINPEDNKKTKIKKYFIEFISMELLVTIPYLIIQVISCII